MYECKQSHNKNTEKEIFQFYVLAYDDGNPEARLTSSKMNTNQIM